MIELTLQQRKELAQPTEIPPRAKDPDTQTTYVLVREDVYDRLKSLLTNEDDAGFLGDVYPHVMEVFAKEGWDDPAMDIYNELDPRRNP